MDKKDINLPANVDENLQSPSEFTFEKAKFWKEDITNNDLLKLYKRKGIAFRTINKQTSLMFKNGFMTDDETANQIKENFNFDDYVKYAYKNSLISGISLIYVDYGENSGDYEQPVPSNAKALGYYVITKAWIKQDIYYNQQVYDYYEIYKADGSSFNVHKSRFIRVKSNEDEISKLLPAYDSLQVLDNVLWGVGQTMFRSGSGFPILKVKNGTSIINVDGTNMTRMGYYKKMGFLRDMNTQTGFIIDEIDDFKFEGAEGKALSPLDYYTIAFQQTAVDLDVPVDILKGVSAGAVTGSETNLKDYYGDLAAKQIEFLEPIYDEMYKTQGYEIKEDYKWLPIFEETKKEISENLTKDVKAIHDMELYNYFSHEQAVKYFADNYEILDYDEKEINELSKLEKYEKQSSFSFNSDSISNDEESALPKNVQITEKKYDRELTNAFNQTQKNVSALLQGFNTD